MSEVIIQVSQIAELNDAGENEPLTTLGLTEATGLTETLELQLANGASYVLNKRDPRFSIWKQFLKWQRDSKLPVYVEAETTSRIVRELLPVFTRRIESVDPVPIGGRLRVMFEASPAIYYLNPALPGFLESRERLESASRDNAEVFVTHHPLTFEIIDVRDAPVEPPGLPNGVVNVEPGPPGVHVGEFALPMSEITVQQAFQVFGFLAESGIPFSFVWDCCTARAQKMCRLLSEDHNILARKIWNYGHGYKSNIATLFIKTQLDPSGKVFWRYHVAPTVRVVDGPVDTVVLDPSMFTTPVAVGTWLLAQNDAKSSQEFSESNVYENKPDSPNDIIDPDVSLVEAKLNAEIGETMIRALYRLTFETGI